MHVQDGTALAVQPTKNKCLVAPPCCPPQADTAGQLARVIDTVTRLARDGDLTLHFTHDTVMNHGCRESGHPSLSSKIRASRIPTVSNTINIAP